MAQSCCPQPCGEQRLRRKGDLRFFLPVLWVCAQGGMWVWNELPGEWLTRQVVITALEIL